MNKKIPDNDIIDGTWYPSFLAGIKSAQYAALHAVNKELVSLYWDLTVTHKSGYVIEHSDK